MTVLTDNAALTLLQIVITLFVVFITFAKWRYTYWKRRGVPSLNPKIPFGDAKQLLIRKYSFGEQFLDFYRQIKGKGLRHGGVYVGLTPTYIPVDPAIIKHILLKDFPHFVNHGIFINEKIDPLSANLFTLEDARWRNLRTKLTPTFTSGKMKMMYHTLVKCAAGLKDLVDESAINNTAVDVKEAFGRFTTDIIGSVAFGIECNSLKNPEAEFRIYGRKVFQLTPWERIQRSLQFFFPRSILRLLKVRLIKKEIEDFFMKVVKDTVEYREKNNVFRKDFMHLLLQLKNRGQVTDDEKLTDTDGSFTEKALTMNELTAQAFVFFVAGFETSSTTMTFALYELAVNPDIQTKLREEIYTVLEKHDNKLTYEAIMEMNYLEKVLNETLRKYPPIPMLPRVCNKDYIIPDTDILIEKGTSIAISTCGLHNDPEYYPEPEKFDPERFSEENKNKRPSFTWIPFGEGPRICIGLRFGMLQGKIGLVTFIKNYQLKLNEKTSRPLQFQKTGFVIGVAGGVWIDVEKIN